MTTQMRAEIDEIPAAVDRLLTTDAPQITRVARALRAADIAFLISIARGSSDHVAAYLKYASELLLGIPVASVGPSIASVYNRPLRFAKSGVLAVSQSGQSPDIVAAARMAQRGGALTLALTNDPASPLAAACDHTLALHAGPERAVAATKTFVNSAVAGLWVLAEWADDPVLRAAIHALPEALVAAARQDWPDLQQALTGHHSLYCLGRGPAYAMACEAALKFKETCQIHAEAYSSAEVLHGPVSIVAPGFPVLALAIDDAAEPIIAQTADQIAAKGAAVFITSNKSKAHALPAPRTGHPLTDPIALITSFYAMVEATARARGIDPDAPRHLSKVTETT